MLLAAATVLLVSSAVPAHLALQERVLDSEGREGRGRREGRKGGEEGRRSQVFMFFA